MAREHYYRVTIAWTGNRGTGTSGYRAYARDHEISAEGKSAVITGSSDPAFRGDASRYNPEELLVASLSACHMLWFLHLCSDAGIAVSSYTDEALGEMREHAGGAGEFTKVTLRPRVKISDPARAADIPALHAKAHELCFISRSVNFPIEHEATVET
ncbi:MAG TPA: OsmC family protein [Bryobacteraceae bacterium]